MSNVRQIELITNFETGTTKVFSADKTKGSLAIKALSIGKKFEDNEESLDLALVNDLGNLIVEAYNNQFDLDTLFDGVDAPELFSTLMTQLQMIVSKEAISENSKNFLKKK